MFHVEGEQGITWITRAISCNFNVQVCNGCEIRLSRKVWIDQAVGAAAPGGFVTSGEDPEFLEAPPEAPAGPPGTCRTELLNMNFMSDSFTSWPLLGHFFGRLGHLATLLYFCSWLHKIWGCRGADVGIVRVSSSACETDETGETGPKLTDSANRAFRTLRTSAFRFKHHL